ncbi:two component regulator [Nitzschia inconspicua]|uniref:Two component regulator n=1 Tax=Nitzschia inconspicua TaxID=303405 RepID=A0A9K3LUX3_9STRA|nr:two component regulator [Nitzschia inconspicua]
MVSSSIYRDEDDNDDNVKSRQSKHDRLPAAAAVSSLPAPPMNTFRTLNTFSSLPGWNDDGDDGIIMKDLDSFTEGYFIDEQMDRDDYLNNMDQFSQQSKTHTVPTTTTTKRTRQNKSRSIMILTVLILVVLTIVLGVMLPSSNRQGTGDEESSNSDFTSPDENTTSKETSSPTMSPTIDPVTLDSNNDNSNNNSYTEPPQHPQQQLNHFFDLAIQWSGEDSFQDVTTSASRALQWLLFQDPWQLMDDRTVSDFTVQQRYVSAVLYFSFLDDPEMVVNNVVFNNTFLSGMNVCQWNNILSQQEEPDGVNSTRGILCDSQGNIQELQFQGLGVSGTLPKELSHLTNLVKINFGQNFISGSIPASLSRLEQLEIIDIRNCSLTGTLPPELSNLSNHLESILLGNNRLSGSVPKSWSTLTNLRQLDLAFNDLTGELSPEFSALQLHTVRLHGNEFSGSLDTVFCIDNPLVTLTANCLDPQEGIECSCCTFCCNKQGLECTLTGAWLGDAGVATTPPDVVTEKLEKLQAILEPISGQALQDPDSHQSIVLHWMVKSDPNAKDLDEMGYVFVVQKYVLILIYVATNGIGWMDNSGWLNATEVCAWKGISCHSDGLVDDIDLGNQNLVGTLVSEIGVLGNSLQSLMLHGNRWLTGRLPSEVGLLTYLTSLDVSGCQFSGPLPPNIGGLSSISIFNIEENFFSGHIPSEIGGMVQAKSLLLGSNSFTGEVPSEIGSIASLERLVMKSSKLSGTIPTQLSGLERLSHLDLSRNSLSGRIPSELGSLILLEDLFLDANTGINGTVPEDLAFLPRLKQISVHGTGVIGNLDLLFCTGEVQKITANCLDPLVKCTCCALCCDANGEKCTVM